MWLRLRIRREFITIWRNVTKRHSELHVEHIQLSKIFNGLLRGSCTAYSDRRSTARMRATSSWLPKAL